MLCAKRRISWYCLQVWHVIRLAGSLIAWHSCIFSLGFRFLNARRFYTLSSVVLLTEKKRIKLRCFAFSLPPISRILFVLKADLFFPYSFLISDHVKKLWCFSLELSSQSANYGFILSVAAFAEWYHALIFILWYLLCLIFGIKTFKIQRFWNSSYITSLFSLFS